MILLERYPHLYTFFSNVITRPQLAQLYDKCDIIKYINLSKLDNLDRFKYVYQHGYTIFAENQEFISLPCYLSTEDIKTLNDMGKGFGYLIDGTNWLVQASLIRSALIELN